MLIDIGRKVPGGRRPRHRRVQRAVHMGCPWPTNASRRATSARATRAATTTPSASDRSSQRRHATSCRSSSVRDGPSPWRRRPHLQQRSNLRPGEKIRSTSSASTPRSRAVVGALAGAGALRPGRRIPSQSRDEEPALFLGQDLLPFPEEREGPHLSLPVLQRRLWLQDLYTWPVRDTPQSPNTNGPYPKDTLGDWIPPTIVTTAASAARTATSPSCPARTASSTRPALPAQQPRHPDRLRQARPPPRRPAGTPPLPAGPPDTAARCARCRRGALERIADADQGTPSTTAGRRRSACGVPITSRRR